MLGERKIFATRSSAGNKVQLFHFSNGAAHIDAYQELPYLLDGSEVLMRKLAKPVRNGDNVDWYAAVSDLKLLSELKEEVQLSIGQKVKACISAAEKGCIHPKGKEFLRLLLENNIILSNGSEEVIIWGYAHTAVDLNSSGLNGILTNLDDLKKEAKQRREEHGGKLGNLTISLIWDTDDDLDLHVVEPSGEKIHFSKKNSSSGGRLDVDANESAIMEHPVENVFWENPPIGAYRVIVNCFKRRSSEGTKPIPFEILVSDEVTNNHKAYKGNITTTNLLEELPLNIEVKAL